MVVMWRAWCENGGSKSFKELAEDEVSRSMASQARTIGFFAPCAYGFGVDATVFLEDGKRFEWVKRTYTRIILRENADGLARSSVSNVIC
ncbi:hypothetical protein V9T40_001455 [Parthenolecanium corni]|uniref:Uncharacterized protein n=1 Tax=Parthenolecanium corni TaxID=536013 RepID=A0AAN9TIM8_9HEMI